MKPTGSCSIVGALKRLKLEDSSVGTRSAPTKAFHRPTTASARTRLHVRFFSVTAVRSGTWLEPRTPRTKKMMKGRPRVPTGGSTKGTTVAWGDYGLRMYDRHRRISAKQLKVAEDTIKRRLRGERYRLYKRVTCNVGVFTKGNDVSGRCIVNAEEVRGTLTLVQQMRMGKGKGSFDHWATRVAVNQIVFELRGEIHEQVARDAFRLAGHKLPGFYEFVKKGEPPIVGITKLDGVTLEELKRPWEKRMPPDEMPFSPAVLGTPSETIAPACGTAGNESP